MTLKQQMNEWRAGLGPLPADYIAMHEAAARHDLPRFLGKLGLVRVRTLMVSDGWCDGMKVLQVEADDAGTLRTFRWSDSNGGSWFEKRAGLSLVELAPNAPGRV